MGNTVISNEADIANLKNQLDTAGQEYKTNYDKLQSVVNQVGVDFKGTPADEFQRDFNNLQPTFESIQSEVDKAYGYVEEELNKHKTLMADLSSDMNRRAA